MSKPKEVSFNRVCSVTAHVGSVSCARFGLKSAGEIFATGSCEDRKINLWQVGRASALASLTGHTSGVVAIAFDRSDEVIVSGCSGGSIRIWDIATEKCQAALAGHRASCLGVEFHPFGNFFATGGAEGQAKIWDLRSRKSVQSYKVPAASAGGIGQLQFSPHGRWLATCGGVDGVVHLWDISAGKLLSEFSGHQSAVTALAFHPGDFFLVSSSMDRTTRVWSCEDFSLAFNSEFDPSPQPVSVLRFGAGGSQLVGGSSHAVRSYGWTDSAALVLRGAGDAPWKGGRLVDFITSRPQDGNSFALATDFGETGLLGCANVSVWKMAPEKIQERNIHEKVKLAIPVPQLKTDFTRFLEKRLEAHKRVSALWTKGQTVPAAYEASQDPAVFIHFLKALPLEKYSHPLTLDFCRVVLQLIFRSSPTAQPGTLLASAATHALGLLLNRFSAVIKEGRLPVSSGVDLQRDLRIEKCNDCFDSLRRLLPWALRVDPQLGDEVSHFLDTC